MVKKLLVFFVLLASAYFFKFVYLPGQIGLVLVFGANVLMLFVVLISAIYDRSKKFHQFSGISVGLIFLALLFGAYGATWGHNQSFLLSLWAQTSMYFYLFYFFLHALKIRPAELEKMLIIMGFLYIGFFLFQYVVYPRMFFGGRANEERGTVRLFFPGSSFAGFMYYYFLYKLFTDKKVIYVVYALLILAIPILQGTRSSILTFLLGTLLFVLFSRQVKSKFAAILLMSAAVLLVFFLFQDIITNLIEVSQTQASQENDDIRVRSSRFYALEFSPTPLNFWIGNGEAHGASSYGLKVFFYKSNFGFYQSDIGIIGEYSKYGVLWLICVVLIFIKLFSMKVDPRYGYIKIWAVLLISNELLGGAFSRSTEIIIITSVLYIYDISNFEMLHEDKETEEIKLSG